MTVAENILTVLCLILGYGLIVEITRPATSAPKPRQRRGTWTQDDSRH